MTEIHKKYRLTSMEEPTDEMLQELMEDVAQAARESSAKAEAEKQRRQQQSSYSTMSGRQIAYTSILTTWHKIFLVTGILQRPF